MRIKDIARAVKTQKVMRKMSEDARERAAGSLNNKHKDNKRTGVLYRLDYSYEPSNDLQFAGKTLI